MQTLFLELALRGYDLSKLRDPANETTHRNHQNRLKGSLYHKLLVCALQLSPQRRRFPNRTNMPFQADATRQRLTIPIKRYIFYLVVVYDVGLSSRIFIRIELLFARCACARDHCCVDDFELAVALLTPLDEESSVVQLRLR